jgi:LCP family protein required for cell wall assembly
MLDHLDDPDPFVPDGRFRERVARRGTCLRRRHRLAQGSIGALATVGLLGSGLLYVERRDAAIDRVEITTQPSADGAVNLLLVGVDEHGGRTDTMIVVRFEDAGSVRMLSIPRDLWDAGTGSRINNANVTGGLQSLLDSIDRTTGIPIDHVVELDFGGFRQLVDAVGGVQVAVDAAVRDESTGLDLPPSSCSTVDGETTLALLRARHLEVQDASGAWITDPAGDLGRTARAHVVARAALTTVAASSSGPLDLDRYSRVLADHAVLDDDLTLDLLVDLGRRLVAAGPTGLESDTIPVEAMIAPEQATVLTLAPGAADVLTRYGSSNGTDMSSAADEARGRVPADSPLRSC